MLNALLGQEAWIRVATVGWTKAAVSRSTPRHSCTATIHFLMDGIDLEVELVPRLPQHACPSEDVELMHQVGWKDRILLKQKERLSVWWLFTGMVIVPNGPKVSKWSIVGHFMFIILVRRRLDVPWDTAVHHSNEFGARSELTIIFTLVY